MSKSRFSPSNLYSGNRKSDVSDISVFSATTKQPLDKAQIIQGRDPIKQTVKTRTSLMGENFKVKQRKISQVKGTKFTEKQMHQNQVEELFAARFQTGGVGQKRSKTCT